MKRKKRKHGKPKEKSFEEFVRDDVPIAPAKGEKSHKSKKRIKKSNHEDFHEYYY